ncbi:CHASE domain-containing protein [Caldimonas sp. KR1-144]|uniref:CHASE domain-containing protein n=1 Tax=Caldimonas sp. KR1-144 TaxID=3400911 RepID=UPI003C08E721
MSSSTDSAAPASHDAPVPLLQAFVGTAIAYALTGLLAMGLAIPPGYASPLYPATGIALVAVLRYGMRVAPAVLLGSFAVNLGLGLERGLAGWSAFALPTWIGIGAMLQAMAGAALARRFVRQPLTLDAPADIGYFFGLAGMSACLINASWATLGLLASGTIHTAEVPANWGTWWVGDTLGVMIAGPIALTLVGQPREAWAPRRGTVALPLLVTTVLLALAVNQVNRWADQREQAAFERDAIGAARTIALRLASHVDALEGARSLFLGSEDVNREEFQRASSSWVRRLPSLQAIGWHQRVPRSQVEAFEMQGRIDGHINFKVFQRDAAIASGDDEVIAMRFVEPEERNAAALGVNVLSIPASREAIARAVASDEAVASRAFRLTQETATQTGVVVYEPVRHAAPPGEKGELRGLVFVTLRMDDALRAMREGLPAYLQICLVDLDDLHDGHPLRLSGPPGCERQGATSLRDHRLTLPFAGRRWEARIAASPSAVQGAPGGDRGTAWLFSLSGLAAAAMMGALLLTVTGRTRRIESAVQERTGQLREQIAEREQAEAALRISEQRFRSIFNSVPLGVVYTDLEGRIDQFNESFRQLLQRPDHALTGHGMAEFTHADDRTEDARLRAALASGEMPVVRRRKRLLRPDGAPFWVEATVTPLRADGEPARLVAVIEDISEHLRLEAAERDRDRAEAANRAKDEFLSRMSHELRTPLNAMLGFAQLLGMDRQQPLGARQADWVSQIQHAGWHLLEMINEVLDLSRIESGTLALRIEPQPISPLLDAVLSMVEVQARARDISLMQRASFGNDARVLGDATRLRQVLLNLLSNAIKYNREGGSVLLSARVREESGLGRPALEVAVSDTGLGLTDSQLAHLFEPFNRLGREGSGTEGTGIGLVISKLLVERMGGTLGVSSEAGRGSTFTVLLPLAERGDDERAATEPAALAEPDYHARHVLYIEDNEVNIEIMRGMLAQRPQVKLDIARTGLDGLAAVRTAPPDLVLLDINLPDIDGLTLLTHLQSDPGTATIPVVIVSADAMPAQIAKALAAGARHYLTKPVAAPTLLGVIDEWLQQADTRFDSRFS